MKLKNTVTYLKSPGMRFFWLFLALAIVLLVVDLIYLAPVWTLVDLATLTLLGALIFWSGLRLTKSSLAGKSFAGRLESVITNLSDGVVVYDSDFKILVFNNTAEDIFHVKKEQVVGKQFGPERAGEPEYRLLTQTIFPSLAPAVIRRSEAGAYPQVVDISFPDREIRVSTNRLLDESGKTVGFVKVVQDRTREVELLKSKSEFITIAAHQLRTPLTAVNWIFEGFSKSEDLIPEDRELAGNGLAATRKLLKIVNDLLDVSKIEEGRFGYNFESVNLLDFISEVLTNAQAVAKEYGVKLYFDKGGESSIMVTIDPNRLGLGVSNLIDNAIRYNVENGSVTIGIKRVPDKPYAEVSIKDTGIGIPPQNMSKVFSKFFRAENVMKRETEGSGLGLYITKNIVSRHGGIIWAESVIDRGTTFFFTLPTDSKLIPPREVGIGE